MKQGLRLLTSLLLLTAVAANAMAQDDIDYEKMEKAAKWYADRADGMLTRFEGLRHDAGQLPQKYYVMPYKGAGELGFALAVATWDEREIILFTPNGGDVTGREIARSEMPSDDYWNSISQLGLQRTPSADITLKERPMPVRDMDKARNTFMTVVDTKEAIDGGNYNRMIFKPHQNAVRLATKHRDLKKDEQGNVFTDETQYTFKLKDPAVVAKMFRGYQDGEAVPWVVKSSFFDDHILLQYNRWKEGEQVRKASADERQIISRYYGGRRIKDTRWVATAETVERTFYSVQFEHQGKDALGALVCIAEGEVVSAWEFHGVPDPVGSIWFVDDDGDFIAHSPEIHCMVATPEGLELYVRLYGGESVQYFILREMGSVLMEIQSDYWVYSWD